MNRDNLEELIVKTHSEQERNRKEYRLFDTNVFIINQLPENIELNAVIGHIENNIPRPFIDMLDAIYIGNFKEFQEKDTNAFYADGAIYASSDQDNNLDLVDDIVHELAHAVEEYYGQHIYGDKSLEKEFLIKRSVLERTLRTQGFETKNIDFLNVEYTGEFDNFLYQTIGYARLEILSANLFIGPYAITSLREYFATGFEEYYLTDAKELKFLCPKLYNKLKQIDYLGGDYEDQF